MRKYLMLLVSGVIILVLSNCNASKKAAKSKLKSTYGTNLSVVIMNNCVPCHIPAKGGNKRPYDNYANVKEDIDEMLRRIQLTPGEKGFMPFKRDKLNDSTIAVFKQWKEDGMLE